MPGLDPIFFVRVSPSGKHPERVDQTSRIRSLEYEDDEAKADRLKLSVDNYDLSNFDAPIWRTGNHLEVSWGYEGNMSPTRQMKIQKVTGSLVLSVEALDESVVMNKVPGGDAKGRGRTFEKMSHSAVAEQIAGEYGFTGEFVHVEDTKEAMTEITQSTRMTDAQLLQSLAKRYGYQFYVDFDGFHFHPRRLDKKPLRKFTYFVDQTRGDIISWNIENDIYGGKTGAVVVKGIDPLKKGANKGMFTARADNSTETKRTTLAGAGGLRAAVGKGKISYHDTEEQARAAGTAIIPTTEKTEASAKRQAQGIFQKAQLQAVQLTMECVGDPAMLAKNNIEVEGIGKTISGVYHATTVTHKVGAGYRMTVKCKRDGKASDATAQGQDFTKDKPKPEEENTGKPNTQKPDEQDSTKSGGAPDKLTAKVEGGKVVYVQGG
jgi:phage protein D